MSRMKDFLLEQIDSLSAATGYSAEFLLDIWNECVADGDSWAYFRAVTLERDW